MKLSLGSIWGREFEEAVRQWLQSSESGCFCVKGLNQVEEAKEEASVYIPPYNSFWIATGKKRSLCQFMLDKGLLCGRRSRNSVAMASNNTSVNWTTFKFHAWSWASDTEKAKGTVKSSIPGILLKGRKFLWWLLGHCSAEIMTLLQLFQGIQFLYILLNINICFLLYI